MSKAYEVWYDYFDGTQANRGGYKRKVHTYLHKENAILKRDELNQAKDKSYPYYLKEIEIEDYDKVLTENNKKVLEDFMNILNEIQYYFQPDTKLNDLDHKDYADLVRLSSIARDMLQNMRVELK